MSEVQNEKKAKPLQGVVTSDKMEKSRVVTIERLVKHARYGKYSKRRTKIMFHDEKNESRTGDTVLIMASRPYSASKRFSLYKILQKAGGTVE
jgi:small subunit ribosomal protein S17